MSNSMATASVPFERDNGHVTITARDGDINTPLPLYEFWVITKASEDVAPNIRFTLDYGELQTLYAMIGGLIRLR